MDKSTQDQIKALDSYGYKEKLILLYSWYNYFLKKDFSKDKEREDYLINKLNEKLEECFSDNIVKATRLFKLFNENNKERIVFLKGLVPYVLVQPEPDKTVTSTKGRKNKSYYSQDINSNTSDGELDKLLNASFKDEYSCLNELIKKIYSVHKSYESLKSSSCTLTTNLKDATVILDFGKFYDDFSKEYISSQHEEYILYPPEYNTSQALCYNLSIGCTGFSGISRDLFPLDNAVSTFMHNFSNFIDRSLKINITTNDEGKPLDSALNGDFIKDRIKNEFLNGIKQLYILFLITSNQSEWEKLYLDWGDGVKYRRSQKIYSIIQQIFSSSTVVTRDTSFKVLNDSIQTVINQYANIISN